jgi:hypothetical protein
MRRCALRVASLAAAVAAFAVIAPPATATAIDPLHTKIDATARLDGTRKVVRVTGQVRCARCDRFTLVATVSQRSTGALAVGGLRCLCRSDTERWSLKARVGEPPSRFVAGVGRICAWVVARNARGKPIDAFQWCRDIKLLAQ